MYYTHFFALHSGSYLFNLLSLLLSLPHLFTRGSFCPEYLLTSVFSRRTQMWGSECFAASAAYTGNTKLILSAFRSTLSCTPTWRASAHLSLEPRGSSVSIVPPPPAPAPAHCYVKKPHNKWASQWEECGAAEERHATAASGVERVKSNSGSSRTRLLLLLLLLSLGAVVIPLVQLFIGPGDEQTTRTAERRGPETLFFEVPWTQQRCDGTPLELEKLCFPSKRNRFGFLFISVGFYFVPLFPPRWCMDNGSFA